MSRKRLYIDMDNVLVDFESSFSQLSEDTFTEYEGRLDEVPGIFSLMEPMAGAIESFTRLSKVYDIYILSTSPWHNPSAWIDKLLWVQKHFGADESSVAYKRLILSHHKNLNEGDFLVDDRLKNGVEGFKGEHIHFLTDDFPTWKEVESYLTSK